MPTRSRTVSPLTPTMQRAVLELAQTIALSLADHCSPDALLPEIENELTGCVEQLMSEMAVTDDELEAPPGDFGGDDTNAHGFYGTHTTDAAW